jgi:hypothetical protein
MNNSARPRISQAATLLAHALLPIRACMAGCNNKVHASKQWIYDPHICQVRLKLLVRATLHGLMQQDPCMVPLHEPERAKYRSRCRWRARAQVRLFQDFDQ